MIRVDQSNPASPTERSPGKNAIAIEAWNTILFEKFCRFRFVLTHGLADQSNELLRRRPFPARARALDVDRGFGDTTQLNTDLTIAAPFGAYPGGERFGSADGRLNPPRS
jgi:hypothetical protein